MRCAFDGWQCVPMDHVVEFARPRFEKWRLLPPGAQQFSFVVDGHELCSPEHPRVRAGVSPTTRVSIEESAVWCLGADA